MKKKLGGKNKGLVFVIWFLIMALYVLIFMGYKYRMIHVILGAMLLIYRFFWYINKKRTRKESLIEDENRKRSVLESSINTAQESIEKKKDFYFLLYHMFLEFIGLSIGTLVFAFLFGGVIYMGSLFAQKNSIKIFNTLGIENSFIIFYILILVVLLLVKYFVIKKPEELPHLEELPTIIVNVRVGMKRMEQKRTYISCMGRWNRNLIPHVLRSTKYLVLFHLADGREIEFSVPSTDFAQLKMGDVGKLTYQGDGYRGFKM